MNRFIRLRVWAKQNLFFSQVLLRFQGVDPKIKVVQRGVSCICIEGYPRSANSFTVRLFRTANDGHIGHHMHAIGNVARAIHYQIPTVILVRDPIDAISSLVVSRCGGKVDCQSDIDYGVWYYLVFYRWVIARSDSVVIADFETVLRDFNRVIRRVNEKYHTTFNCIENLEIMIEQVQRDFRDHFTAGNDTKIPHLESVSSSVLAPLAAQRQKRLKQWLPVPDDERQKRKKAILPVLLDHKYINEAQALYTTLKEYGI